MESVITVVIPISPTREQQQLLDKASKEYIALVNELVDEMIGEQALINKTSKTICADLNSSVKCQAVRDAKSVFKKVIKSNFQIIPRLKKPICIWNNQNYRIFGEYISLPLMVKGKSTRIKISAAIDERSAILLQYKLGSLRLSKKNNRYVAQIAVTLQIPLQQHTGEEMGIDLGLKVPAVSYITNGKIKFYGNGRKNKYLKRVFRAKRKALGKAKQVKVIKRIADKEQRIMRDSDHKVSRQIIDEAIKNNVTLIRMEELRHIRQTARTSRKNEKNLHSWSFYRLAAYIEYKARLAGIAVEYINPMYTSQKCPDCSKLNKAKDRQYICDCGYHNHRDIVGAINIVQTQESGHSFSA